MQNTNAAIRRCLIGLCLLTTLAPMPAPVQAADAPKSGRPVIYDESADGSKQIADALLLAKKEHKHVLLQFGANWCGWCHKLHKLCETNQGIADNLKSNFVVVMVDMNKDHNKTVDEKYGHPARFGLPALAVLDADGKLLTTKNTSELEQGDHHNPVKVLAFLAEWSPKKNP
jgi:thiol:disulfide interchange protein